MPITAVTIQNFKGIRGPVRVDLRPVTLLFGPNSAGKSTVIQALHYAREIFERENVNPDRTLLGGDTIDLGGFEALVHKHNKRLPIVLRLDIDLANEDLPRYIEGYEDLGEHGWAELALWNVLNRVKSAWVEVSISWSERRIQPILKRYTVGINGSQLAAIQTSDDGRQVFLSEIQPFHPVFLEGIPLGEVERALGDLSAGRMDKGEAFAKLGDILPLLTSVLDISGGEIPGISKPIPVTNQESALPQWGKSIKMERSFFVEDADLDLERELVLFLSSLIVGPGEMVRDALRNFCYLGPLRCVPPRNFQPARTPDESRWANGMAAWDTLLDEGEQFIERVNEWLIGKERLNSGYKVVIKEYKELDLNEPVAISMMRGDILDEETAVSRHLFSLPARRRLLLWEEANGIELLPLDIGVGISQVLPVIVAAVSANGGFVVIEQPELHIHPALQVGLGDLFIDRIKEYPDTIFILETHSEHIMLRLLRRIRETSEGELPPGAPTLTPNELSIYFAEQREEGITLTPIRVDSEGEFIDRWPLGFFRERARELM